MNMRTRPIRHRLYPPYLYLVGSFVPFGIILLIPIFLIFFDIPNFSFTRMWYIYVFALILFFIGMYLLFIFIFTIGLFIVVDQEGIRIKNIFTKDEYVFDKENIENIVTSESSKLTEERYRTGRKYYPYGYWHKNQIYIHYEDPQYLAGSVLDPEREYDSFLFKLKDHESFIDDCMRYDYPMVVISQDEG